VFQAFIRIGHHRSGQTASKVLANAKDQKLENPENLAFDPPALGHVREFQISIKKEYPLIHHPKTAEEDVEEDGRETNIQPLSKPDDAQFRSTIVNQTRRLRITLVDCK
jgi:hypothetical protein